MTAISIPISSCFSPTTALIPTAWRGIKKVLIDEGGFVKQITDVAKIIDGLIAERDLDTREQVRDTLSSEAFGDEFRKC